MKERPKPVIGGVTEGCVSLINPLLKSNPFTFRSLGENHTNIYNISANFKEKVEFDECFFYWKLISSHFLHSAEDRSTQALYSKPPPAGESNHVGGENSTEEVEVLLSKTKTHTKPSFLRSLIKAFGPYFLIGSAFKLLQDLITFVNPQLLK